MGIEQKAFEREWHAMHPVDGEVLRTVETLLANGHAVGLATNFCRRLLNLMMETSPVLSQLLVCCSSDIGLTKPSAEFFRRATEIMGSREIVFIDDRSVNVEAARRFGWTAIHASDGWLARFRKTYVVQCSDTRGQSNTARLPRPAPRPTIGGVIFCAPQTQREIYVQKTARCFFFLHN